MMATSTSRAVFRLLLGIPQSISMPSRTSTRTITTALLDIDVPITPLFEAKRFVVDCMMAVGTPKPYANAIASNVVEADYRGHYSHGMNRLEMYVNDIRSGSCNSKAEPVILKESPTTAWVDGQNGLGAVVGDFCMDIAMKKAKEVGVGWVCAKGSNHYGIAGWYTLQAINSGLLGMSFSNSSPLMIPANAKKAALGANPLSVGAPGNSSDSFILDMATTVAALGKVEMQQRKNEPIHKGWALGSVGKVTTNSEEALMAGLLLPVGGMAGYALGMMIEVFCGLLSGSAYGPNIRKWGDTKCPANLGQCFVAINPECFAPGFKDRMTDLIDYMRNLEPADPCKPVLVPGDPERCHMQAVDHAGGVRYLKNQHDSCARLSEMLKVDPLKCLA